MNRTLSLSTASAALVLFAATLAAPMQANAADRQISVNPNLAKLKTFTVDTRNEQNGIEVANTTPEAPKRVTPKAFRVDTDDEQQAEVPKRVKPKAFRVDTDEEVEQAEVQTPSVPKRPKTTPKRPKTQEFRVDQESGEVADTPIQNDDDEDVVASQPKRPANGLNKKFRVAPVEDDQEQAAVSDEDKEEAIAADQAETAAPAEEEEAVAEVEDDGEPTILRKVSHKKRYKSYVVQHETYTPYVADEGYQQQGYAGSSCHNSYSY